MTNCPNCGDQIPKHAALCFNCGARVGVDGEIRKPAPMKQSPTPVALLGNRERFDLGLLLSSDGRIGRMDYWIILIVGYGLFGVFGVLYAVIDPPNQSTTGTLIAIVGLVLLITVFGVSTLSAIKRLHDIDWSGWVLLANIIPFVSFILLLIFLFYPGSSGRNDYGAPNSGSPFPRLH